MTALTTNQHSLLATVAAVTSKNKTGRWTGQSNIFASTTDIAFYANTPTVDATGKALHRLRERGFIIAKAKGEGRQARYQWRLSSRGRKVIA